MKRICILFLFLSLCACKKLIHHDWVYIFEMVNESGYAIKMETDDAYGIVPSLVVIEPGGIFVWEGNGLTSMMPRDGKVTITFDETYTVVYTRNIEDRNPYWEQNYVITEIRKNVFECVYTFTEQDYLNAVEQSGL